MPFETAPTAIIVEDELPLFEQLKASLHSLWPELVVLAHAQDGVEALRLIETHAPSVVFLDLQIPELSGLEVARSIAGRSHIVFVTAYDSHAIEAFEKGVVDYVLKPINPARLLVTVRRLKEKLQQAPAQLTAGTAPQSSTATPAKSGYLRWITATVGPSIRLITVDEILFFQADQKYTRVVLAEGEVLIKRTLKALMDELDPEQFWQIHRSTVVNALEVSGIEPNMAGQLVVRLKSRREQLPMAESFYKKLRQL